MLKRVRNLCRQCSFAVYQRRFMSGGSQLQEEFPDSTTSGTTNNDDNDTNNENNKTSLKKQTSRVWSWGWGSHGALGHGNYRDLDTPRLIESLSDLDVVDISAGWAHSLALTKDGKVYRWGWADDIKTIYSCANLKVNAPGLLDSMQQVGHKMRLGWLLFDNAELYPRLISELNEIFVTKITCGAATSFALGNDGKVYTWGTGRWGQLGHKIYNHYTEEFIRPTVVERLLGHNIIDMATGYVHSGFLDDSGCLWMCGPGLNGRLGLGLSCIRQEFPIPRPLTPLWRQHFQHQWHKKQKKLRMIDDKKKGQENLRGLIDFDYGDEDAAIAALEESKNINYIDNDKNKIKSSLELYDKSIDNRLIEYNNGYINNETVFQSDFDNMDDDDDDEDSDDDEEQLDSTKNTLYHNFNYDRYFSKFNIAKPYEPQIVKMRAGHKHSVLLTEDGKVWTFGAGNTGALGHRQDFTDKHWPALVNELSNEFIVDIDCGQNHTIALTNNGDIYTWGMSRHGQCGRPRNDAFMLEDVRERGSDLSTLPHRPPFPLIDEFEIEIEEEDENSENHENNENNEKENIKNVYESHMYKDADDGILLRGDPLAMSVGKIDIPSKFRVSKIVAGFYETSIITQCGKIIIYGANAERLENIPQPKIIDFPGHKAVQITHGWRHSIALTVPNDQYHNDHH